MLENNGDLSNSDAEIKRKLRNRVREILINKYNLDIIPRPDSLDTDKILHNLKSESLKSTKHEKSSVDVSENSSLTKSQKSSKTKIAKHSVQSTNGKDHEQKDSVSNKSNSYTSSFEKTSSDKNSNPSSKISSSSEKVSGQLDVRYEPKPLSTIIEVSSHKTKTQVKMFI